MSVKKNGNFIMTIESDDEVEIEPDIRDEEGVEESLEEQFLFDPENTAIQAPIPKENDEHEIRVDNIYQMPIRPEDSDEESSDIEQAPQEDDDEQQDVDEDDEKPSKKKKNDDDDDDEELERDFDKSFFSQDQDQDVQKNSLNFPELKLSKQLLRAISDLGFSTPTPIQQKSIPVALAGRDICASSMTGSGKTAAFVLPILERLLYRDRGSRGTRVLILLPTRELAIQCFKVTEALSKYTDIRTCLAVGGVSLKQQTEALKTKPEIIVCTPGRLVDHLLNTVGFSFDSIEILVLDEADRLLELGFKDELEQIIEFCPKARQTMLFSATMTDEVDKLMALSLKNPVRIQIHNKSSTVSTLLQEFVKIKQKKEDQKESMLLWLCTKTFTSSVIVFCGLKVNVKRLRKLFYLRGLNVRELHGRLDQDERNQALDDFTRGKTDFLICTDVAARGLDIKGLKTVINFDMPPDLKTYLHRVGRTARAGEKGTSVSFIGEADRPLLKKIVKRAKSQSIPVKQREIPSEAIQLWQRRIEKLEPRISELSFAERSNDEIKKAKMEITKAQNIITHQDEIQSRPARTWFKTNSEKKEDRKALKAMNEPPKEEKKKRPLSRRKEKIKRLDQETLRHHGIKDAGKLQKSSKSGFKRKRSDSKAKQFD